MSSCNTYAHDSQMYIPAQTSSPDSNLIHVTDESASPTGFLISISYLPRVKLSPWSLASIQTAPHSIFPSLANGSFTFLNGQIITLELH